MKVLTKEFQSALPLRGATALSRYPVAATAISIRAPLAGSDRVWRNCKKGGKISIRAPLAGSDAPFVWSYPREF